MVDIAGVILAGGRATRMNGRDKGFVWFKSKPMVEHVVNAVKSEVDKLYINANRNQYDYTMYGNVFSDDVEGFQGPLAGILSACKNIDAIYILVVPCDGPYVSPEVITRLKEAMLSSNADICVAHDGEKMQPTYAIIRTSLKKDLEDYLRTGQRKLGAWYKQNNLVEVPMYDIRESFINLNSPEDLTREETDYELFS
jgi:molybdenum cofactor guanylyltransferase